jgi:thioredoxin 1
LEVKYINKEEYLLRKMEIPVLIISFVAEWNGPSRMLQSNIEELASDYKPDQGVFFGLVDIDKEVDIAVENKVNSLPTTLVFKESEVVYKIEGNKKSEDIQSILNGIL